MVDIVLGIRLGLVDPYLKTSRAKTHIENLREQLDVFNQNPCRFIREDDVENGMHIITMQAADIPDKITLIAGDIFYNLRAALDHLVWHLAHLTRSYPKMTQFPILEADDRKRFESQIEGVPPDAAAIIESLQPYYGRNDINVIKAHLPWRLNKLCNIDKHRRIPVHGVMGTIKWLRVANTIQRSFDDKLVMKFPLADKDKVGLNPRVEGHTVNFGDSHEGIECDIAGIDAIYEFVTNSVLPRFARFFT